jgi:hypothetical protein
MQQSPQSGIDLAQLYLDGHWLSHARASCAEVLAGNPEAGEAKALLHEIDRRLENPDVLNLSRDHTPIMVMKDRKSIISTLQFRELNDDRLKQEAFRQAVYYIDVETSSQCNRQCNYCPNSYNDRLTSNRFMADNIFSGVIYDLQAINYEKELHFVGYNEPMLHLDDLLGRISLARKLLPRARLVVFTNGDYLKMPELEKLISAGVNQLTISVHLPVNRPYTDDEIFNRINKIAKRLGTPIRPVSYVKDVMICAQLVHPGIDIAIQQTDYERLGSNRAGTLETGEKIDMRTSACLLPIHQFIVGHKGAVVPCCVMVSDDKKNAEHILGHIGRKETIFDIYGSRRFVGWRQSLYNLGPKMAPCDKCNQGVSMPLNNEPAIYEPWQQVVAPSLRAPIVL